MSAGAAIIVLGESALPLARRVMAAAPDARLHGLAGRVSGADVVFAELGGHLRALFAEGTPIVGLCAAGVLIRALAPALGDKRREPPVVALAEDGSAVVPLLGGHHGANALARRVGEALGVVPAVTTAGDLRFGIALDEPPAGYRLANAVHVKAFTAALLAGAKVWVEGDAPWLKDSMLPIAEDGALVIRVSDRPEEGSARLLIYHPATIAIGVGCERGADPDELISLVRMCLVVAGAAPGAAAGIFSLDLKADERAVHDAAAALGVEARFFTAAELEAEAPRLANPSEAVFRKVGCHGVAEGAALAAVGPSGRLILPKHASRRATCAIARAPTPLDAAHLGRARGRLFIVGIGPGGAAWLTPEASAMLAEASDVVGYRLYLELLGPLARDKALHAFALGEEEARVRAALELAAAGRKVALVSSGDPGIYAMAALAFELIDGGEPAWRRIAVQVTPGISAMQAAAARVGAPLGHDFCAISLSDLLTPWPVIEQRLRAAAEGDFVVALYNPASRGRTHQLETARTVLLRHRSPDTPVVLARNLGRAGESVRVTRLDELASGEVDMLTLVLVGNSATRAVARGEGGMWVFTPRGYGAGERSRERRRKEAG